MQTPVDEAIIHRHRFSTRVWHWLNAVILLVMLMSGLMVLNAHPRLYWGEAGANADYAWLEIGSKGGSGFLRLGDFTIETTGFLGVWQDANGRTQIRAFPGWATIPSQYNLALSRRWHLTFAWLFAVSTALYAAWSVVNGHLKRDLLPRANELRGRHLWSDIKRHARLDFPKGAAAQSYNTLQKISYVVVLLVLLPVMILTGMTMSPALDASWGWLSELFGGRQSARSIHFIAAMALVAFVVIHLVMVTLSGPINEIRSMITGRYRLPGEKTR
ncbi:MAG: cytochrome b/b6 domain-containing protein [Steroidobacteraceae bacterium]